MDTDARALTAAQPTNKIRFSEKLGFLAFSGSNNIVYLFHSTYYLLFLTNALGIDVFWAGTIITVGTLWDAVNDPLLGFIAVNHRFKSGESVRPFIIQYAVPWAISVVLLFTDFGLHGWQQIAFAMFIYFVYEVFNTLVGIPYNSMAGLATNSDTQRLSINTFRTVGAGVGTIIGSVAILPLLQLAGGLDKNKNLSETTGIRGFFIVACVMAVITAAGCAAHYFSTRERVHQQAESAEKISFGKVLKMLTGNRNWWLNSVYIICYSTINMLLMSNLNYYAQYVLGSLSKATLLQIAYIIGGAVAVATVAKIDAAFGRRKSMVIAVVVAIVGKVWFIVQPTSIIGIYVNAFTSGIAITMAFVMFSTNRNEIVDILEAKHGERVDSMIASTDNLASKFAVAGASQILAVALDHAGFISKAATQPAEAISVINTMLGWVPLLVSLVMLAAAAFIHIEKDYKDARDVLDERANQEL